MSPSPTRVLFVCLGNICRSPAAENIFRNLVDEAGLTDAFEIDSAGTMGWHTGKTPDDRMRTALAERDFSNEGSARQADTSDFERFNLIVAMDDSNFTDLESIRPPLHGSEGDELAKLVRFCEYVREHPETEVPDPYEGNEAGFFHVIDILVDGCENLLAELRPQTSESDTATS